MAAAKAGSATTDNHRVFNGLELVFQEGQRCPGCSPDARSQVL
jgi:hypothetical protein